MNANRKLIARPVPLLAFGAVAVLGALVLAQVSPQPQVSPQAQRGNARPASQNQVAPATDQPANQAARAPNAIDNSRQAAGTDRASSDSRSRRSAQSEEQDAAWLGVFLSDRDNDSSATVAHVYPAGPAARAGIQSGDVIQQVNGQQVSSGQDLVAALEKMHPGDKAEINVLRNNEPTKLTATLGSRDSFISRNRSLDRFSGRGGQGSQYDENEDMYNIPLHAMELEHNRRMAEQHQRIETEIAQLRDEIRQLRESLQRR
jgi:C-terminal processing protease CtpA/Prc